MPWAAREDARAVWQDAPSNDDVLDDLLAEAYEECWGYAPLLLDRTVSDGVTTAGSRTVTSATAAFREHEVGRLVTIAGQGTATIDSVLDSGTIMLATPAATSATGVSVTVSSVPRRFVKANILQAREIYNASVRGEQDVIGVGDYAIRARPLTAAVKQLLRPQRVRWTVG